MSGRHHRGTRHLFCVLVSFLCLASTQRAVLAADTGLIRLDVTIGKSQVLNLQEPFTRISVTNPAIADVFVVTPNQILVNGKSVGVTSLVVDTRIRFTSNGEGRLLADALGGRYAQLPQLISEGELSKAFEGQAGQCLPR